MKPKTDPRESKRRPLNLKMMTKMPIVRTKLKPTELPQIEKKNYDTRTRIIDLRLEKNFFECNRTE